MVLSALIHLWFAAGMAVDTPVPVAPHGQIITARLELSATPPAIPVVRQTETPIAEKIARRDSRPRGRSIYDSRPKSSATSRSTATSPAADPVYYPARQLDVYPALLHPVRPDYPEQSSQSKASGKVRMTLLIDETGHVTEVSAVEAEPAGYFEDAVRRAFASARFSPARKDGRAVKSRVLISIAYGTGEAESAVR
jgi:TonB family protein